MICCEGAKATQAVCGGYEALRPPKRLTVAEGAASVLVINQPGGYVGPWSATETPYMVEPMNTLASRRHEAVCFVGPARTGKTAGLLDGWVAHAVVNDPGDMLIVQMTQDKAREFSKTRIDRALRHSPKLAALKSASAQHDNTHDKQFRHGMWLRIAWPTVSNLSSSDYRYVGFTDYDRMPDDVDGEGAPFALGLKRTTTFLSRGMCMVESSPGRDVADPRWAPATPHEAPPTGGVLGVFNRSDRRRWYWPCPECSEYFEVAPGLSLFNLPSDSELLEVVRTANLEALAKQYAVIACPHCGSVIEHRQKHALNQRGVWLADGEKITPDGVRYGTAASSTIAGFWLGGCAAAYQPWKSILMRYLQGLREYALTGSELTLKTTVNTDQGMPYTPRALVEAAANTGEARIDDALERFVVPEWARFLAAAVDVQGGSAARFVVQVHAVGEHFEQALVDRYEIRDSKRQGVGTEFAPIDPASYAEDWALLTEKVLSATYRTPDEGRELRVLAAAVDSGGEDGVTENAYAWWRSLKALGLQHRAMLVKGAPAKDAPLLRETRVGGMGGRGKGDVPLFLLNTNMLKDAVHAGLRRATPGPGFIHLPAWVPKAFHDELFNAEVRDPKTGAWSKIRQRNEAFDLACYIRAVCLRLGVDKIKDWSKAPPWARPWRENRELVSREERREMKQVAAAAPLPAAPVTRPRRASRSSYVRG